MSSEESERKLAAVMFTDIVGYTALTQSDEAQALELVQRQNKLLHPLFTKFHGREVKSMGDAFLVEFDSALEATRCAISIQEFLHDYNLSTNDLWKIKLRIGIHVGDIVHKDKDIFGDAVNIASRIEPLAAPEGVCISEQVFDQIHNKIDYALERLKEAKLKNVKFATDVYSVIMPWENNTAAQSKEGTFPLTRLAVLPFANISPDPNDEYFSDGLTEELIDRLCQLSELEIIARTSVMNYKKKEKSVREIAKELQVGSIVEGSVRKFGNRIRVTSQLINCNTEAHLWSNHYDRNLDDIFAVQSDIAENVASALRIKLLHSEKHALEHKGPWNPEAYNEYLKGLYFHHKSGREDEGKAIEHFQKALQIEPNYPEAMAFLGICIAASGYAGYERQKSYARASEIVMKAIELDETIPESHYAMGTKAFLIEADWEKADKELRRALELNPNYLDVHIQYALTLVSIGRRDESIVEIEKALRLDPLSARAHTVAQGVYALAGKFGEAIEHFQKAIELEPNSGTAYNNLGFTFALMGKWEEGLKSIEKAFELDPSPFVKANLAYGYAVTGNREQALKLLEEIRADSRVSGLNLAHSYAALGDKDEALNCLEKAYENRTITTFPMFHINPLLASLRDEPRFKELVKKLGLDKYTTV